MALALHLGMEHPATAAAVKAVAMAKAAMEMAVVTVMVMETAMVHLEEKGKALDRAVEKALGQVLAAVEEH
ncbi:hypothetical protein D3C74_458120 [compost metagenome]